MVSYKALNTAIVVKRHHDNEDYGLMMKMKRMQIKLLYGINGTIL